MARLRKNSRIQSYGCQYPQHAFPDRIGVDAAVAYFLLEGSYRCPLLLFCNSGKVFRCLGINSSRSIRMRYLFMRTSRGSHILELRDMVSGGDRHHSRTSESRNIWYGRIGHVWSRRNIFPSYGSRYISILLCIEEPGRPTPNVTVCGTTASCKKTLTTYR